MSDLTPKVKGQNKAAHMITCFGAATVILGALFKIMHYPGASIMLPVGLIVETGLFIYFGFDIPHEEIDWSLAYPALRGANAHEVEEEMNKLPVTEQLNNMLEEAQIGPELIEKLGSGMRSLSDSAGKIGDLSAASVATNEYAQNMKKASAEVSHLTEIYQGAASSMQELSESGTGAHSIGESINKVAKNLSALNASYELQLQGSQAHLDATNKFYSGIADMMKSLESSVDDTKKYKEEIATLSKQLSALNTVYGNMLSAMNVKA